MLSASIALAQSSGNFDADVSATVCTLNSSTGTQHEDLRDATGAPIPYGWFAESASRDTDAPREYLQPGRLRATVAGSSQRGRDVCETPGAASLFASGRLPAARHRHRACTGPLPLTDSAAAKPAGGEVDG
jgi:hypothetical protein